MISIYEVIGKKNIKEALYHLDKKSFNDKELINFKEYLDLNLETLKNNILSYSYSFDDINLKTIVNYKNKKRLIAKLSLKDKFIMRCLSQILDKYIGKTFCNNSFAYQINKGTIDALKKIKEYVELGYNYVLKVDIDNYFDNINHEILISKLRNYKIDSYILDLIIKSLKCEVVHENLKYTKNIGILQGSPLSSILSNIYLDDLDNRMFSNNIKYIRYCDDIFIFSKNRNELERYYDLLKYSLSLYNLNLKREKIYMGNIFNTNYLGYKIIRNKSGIEIIKNDRNKLLYYNNWTDSKIPNDFKEYNIINNGILSQRDYTLLFENKEKKSHLPVENIDCINIYSNIIFSSSLFNIVNSKNIIVNIFDKNNRYIGKFLPNTMKRSSLTLLKQVSIYNDDKKRIDMAKNILFGEIHNIKENIKYYEFRHKGSLNNKLKQINDLEKQLLKINSYSKVLIIEAKIREIYYSCFDFFIKNKDFEFCKRTRRPPQNSVNCMISFGNVLLYNLIAKEIYKTSLDIRIAYLHASNNRYESLNLDLADIFKPIIIDKIIFKLINKGIINNNLHFEKRGRGIYLNNEGRKIFIKEFNAKLYENRKYENRRISYISLIRKEIFKLSNSINNGSKFRAYKYY